MHRTNQGRRPRNALGSICLVLGIFTLLSPLWHEEVLGGRAGVCLILTAFLEFAHGFRRVSLPEQRSAWVGGIITLLMGLLLLNAPYLMSQALAYLFAGWFGLDGLRHLLGAVRGRRTETTRWQSLFSGVWNIGICLAILVCHRFAFNWVIAIAASLRIFDCASRLFATPVFTPDDSGSTVLADLNLPENEELQGVANRIHEREVSRDAADRGWIVGFILTLFAIHLGRMGLDRTLLRIMSPAFAVVGDVFIGLLLAFVIVIPIHVFWLRSTRGFDRWGWSWCLARPSEERRVLRRLLQSALRLRLRSSIRLRRARYSLSQALNRALQIGLPLSAIIAATFPMWGMSWYFDTENWASGIWNSWAAARTDKWREAMVQEVQRGEAASAPDKAFAVTPPGTADGKDFSFIVIGDPGEGDASQRSLIPQLLDVAKRDDVKFIVISSDVVYPTGAMRDYEAKFWQSFTGVNKPVLAIPGNHDWYDALEGFAATFLTPDAARAVMRARLEVDNRISSTTESSINALIHEASRLSKEYRVTTQLQRAPFFQFQTREFALFAVDTGVVKRIDPIQMNWLKAALESARGKTKMALLGHPYYAGGVYQAEGNADFTSLHHLLKEHDVAIVMAGDTHDLEYYAEQHQSRTVHHFVNGGGGAYLSYGTSLAWPVHPATKQWAYYPGKTQVIEKIEATTPRWKWPAWWWTKNLDGWPFSPEFLSAAFDANVAPFYQSFMEVRVEPSKNQVRLIPYGNHGRLRWADFDRSDGLMPRSAQPDSFVEWVVDMKK
jgi:uncharacterized membrane protein HdeD (DUF308 family)